MSSKRPSDVISTLNEAQQRSLRITCEHIDKLLKSMEEVLNEARSNSVFPKYINDILPVQQKSIEDYLSRIRAQLLRVLAGQAIERADPQIAASHAIHTSLTFVEIAIEELSPSRMSGYGPISAAGAADLNGTMQELQSLVGQLHGYVLHRDGPDLKNRIERLEAPGIAVDLLRRIEEIVTRRGLVEFRSTLQMLLDRMEDTAFEIAFFGRVNSGKSSLLNRVIGADILPVGVTPITAVPTRVSFGREAGIKVWIEGSGAQTFPISQLAEFVDERRNPGNRKRVAKLAVSFPSTRLQQGIVLVDTAGLGSLATSGAAETLAYLPRCDAGVVLIDAASTLASDDLKVIAALSGAAVPVSILLSKTDLLTGSDRQQVEQYVHDQVLEELGTEVLVHPVSSVSSRQNLLDAWLQDDLFSLYARHQELRRQSIGRKIEGLRDSVRFTLERQQRTEQQTENRATLEAIEIQLRRSAGALQAREPELLERAMQVAGLGHSIIRNAAEIAAARWKTESKIDLGEVLWLSATRLVNEITKDLQTLLSETISSLKINLHDAEAALQSYDSRSDQPLFAEREMPVFHMNREARLAPKPLFSGILGYAALRLCAERELRPSLPALNEALSSYAALLRGWSQLALSSLVQQFNIYADRYRAQLERQLSGRLSSEDDLDRIQRDLTWLSESSGVKAADPDVWTQAS